MSRLPKRGARRNSNLTPKKCAFPKRRAYEKTDEFKKRYAMRSGVEATNSSLKRQTGFGRLRYLRDNFN
ncbi:MAG: transposase [Deltaproteobacteria bacterium]|nr:transposase [Deltaproteobacteria bacterium]